MRFAVSALTLVIGTAALWSWVLADDAPRWLVGIAVTALVAHAIVSAPGVPENK